MKTNETLTKAKSKWAESTNLKLITFIKPYSRLTVTSFECPPTFSLRR